MMAIIELGLNIPVLCSLLIGYFFASTFYQWQRLRHIPGPTIASFSYAWLAYCGYTGLQHEWKKHLGDKYGSLARVGPNELLTDDPETLRRISNAKSSYPRSTWYDGARFHPSLNTMFTTVDPVEHDKIKAKVAYGYSGRETPGLEAAIDEQIANLVSLFRRKYIFDPKTSKTMIPLDLSRVLPLFTLDTIARIALGKEFGCLEADKDVKEFYHVMEEFIPILNVCADVPWVSKIVYSTLGIRLFGPKPTDKTGIGLAMKLCNDETEKKYTDDGGNSNDILASFRRHGLTQEQCQTEALFMFMAGSETSSSAIRIALYYLMSTPTAYQALKSEIKSAILDKRASSPIKDREARELPYLQAVIYESMRIRPVTTATFSKVVPPGGDTINGYWVPGGTYIGPNLSSLLRSKALWGPDADLFRPERFLEANEAKRAEMQRNVDVNFGNGRWMCAGKAIALIELNKTIFELLREFDFQILDPKVGFKGRSHGSWVDENMLVGITKTAMFA